MLLTLPCLGIRIPWCTFCELNTLSAVQSLVDDDGGSDDRVCALSLSNILEVEASRAHVHVLTSCLF